MRYLFLLFFSFGSLFAKEIIVDSKAEYNITPQITYYLDKESKLNSNEVLSKTFIDSKKTKLLFGYQLESTLWVKFTLFNPSNNIVEKILEYDYPILREFTLFDLDTGETKQGGFLHAKDYKDTLTQPIRLTFPPNSKRHFLIKANSTDVGLIAKLILWNTDSYYSFEMHNQRILFLFFGAMAALLLYNLFLFSFTKDRAYFYYSMIIMSFLSIELFLQGYFTFIDPRYEVKIWHLYLLLYVMLSGLIMFSTTYLELKKNIPSMHNKLMILYGILTLVTLGSILNIIPVQLHRLSLLISFFLLVSIGFYALYKKIPQAKYYIFGWLLLLMFTVIEAFAQMGLGNLFDNYPHISKINIFLEALMFSIALSARIRLLENEKQLVSQKLYEQKEQESLRLEKNVKERTQALNEALADKDTLLKEVHHRVKNNLQIIISLLRLQSDQIEEPLLQEILGESENRVKAISNVHEMLYQNENLENITTQPYFEELCKDIQTSYGAKNDVKFIIDAVPSLSMDKAIYCGLIINELVTNSFKYAFKDGRGQINIALVKDEGFILTVADDGIGIDASKKENLGMVLIKTLVKKQLKGTLLIDTDNGTKYTIKFKV